MLDFVKRAFRNGIEVILWINLILSTVAGGIIGNFLGKMISYRSSGGYTFLGILIGIFLGILTDIIFGGFITTILSIEKNTEEQTALLKKQLGLSDVPFEKQNEGKTEGKKNEAGKSEPLVPLSKNQIRVTRLNSVVGSALVINVSVDNENFLLANGEEKILDIKNGKHVISTFFNNEYEKLEFEIKNNNKAFNVFIKPPLKIQEV